MNEGAPLMYAGYGGPGLYVMGGGRLEAPEAASPPAPGTPRRSRRPRSDTAFGYESDDDSSLSSNTSSSNKSNEKAGECSQGERGGVATQACVAAAAGGGAGAGYTREWRGRRHQRTRRFPPDRYLNATYPFQVKFAPDDLLNGSKWDTLSQEIWDQFVKSQQTEETFRKKMNLWKYLYVSIKSIFPRYGLYVVGSTMSGFGLESSDMDLCLYVRPLDNVDPRAHALFHLNYILGYIKSFDPGAEVIQAKVPILKFRDAHAGVQVDLNCNNVVGIRNTNLLNCFSKLDWRVRPLVAAAKLWARAHHINDARHRTLSSYSLTLMVIHFLQCGVSPAVLPRGAAAAGAGADWWRPAAPCRLSLGELFCGFLRYYSAFPYGGAAVSVRCGARLPLAACRAHAQEPQHWKLLCVEEPFNLSNTARSVYDPESFSRIVATFRDSYKRLAGSLRLRDAWPLTDR